MIANVNTAVPIEHEYSKVIQFSIVGKDKEVKYNKDGSVRKTKCNKIAGKDSEVYAFRTKEEITAIMNVLDKHIEEAPDENKKWVAHRNKLLFLVGMNIGIRASDLRELRYSFFYDKKEDGTLEFKELYVLQPKKQRKQKKFVKLFFNQTVKTAINNYISEYPIEDLNNYLFSSRKGDEPITVQSLWRIVKDTAYEAGIKQNIGSHSLRKTFGYWAWREAEDKNKALITLQQIFKHSDSLTTMKYIGLLDDEISDMYNSIELGLEYVSYGNNDYDDDDME